MVAGFANANPVPQSNSKLLQPLIRYEAARLNAAIIGKALRAQRHVSYADRLVTYHAKADASGLPPVIVNSTVQTIDLTLEAYTVGASGIPTGQAPSNIDVVWSHDESFLVFASNRTSATDPTPSATGNFHLYAMSPSGEPSSIVQLTSGAGNERWPALAGTSDSGIAYAASAQPTGGPYTLMVAQLGTNGNGAMVVENAVAETSGVDVEHPTYAGSLVAFAARKASTANPYNIYVLSLGVTNTLTQFTSGGCDDENPTFAPTGSILAWDTNAAGYTQTGTPVLTCTSTKSTRDIFVSQLSGVGVTQFTDYAGSNNIEPAWSTTSASTFLNPNSTHIFLFYSSDRRYGVYNIYYLRALLATGGTITVDTEGGDQDGVTGANTAVEVNTSDTANTFNKYQPTVSLLNSYVSVAYVANRYLVNGVADNPTPSNASTDAEPFETAPSAPNAAGTFTPTSTSLAPSGCFEIFTSQLFDIDPPSLLEYDNSINEILHVQDANGNDTRYIQSGQPVTFMVRLSDRQSGVGATYLQIKDPNSKYQDQAGLEHKVFTHAYSGAWDDVTSEATTLFAASGDTIDNNGSDQGYVGHNVLTQESRRGFISSTIATPGAAAGAAVAIPINAVDPVTSNFQVGNYLIINNQEIEMITAVAAGSITVGRLQGNYAAGATVLEPPAITGVNYLTETAASSGDYHSAQTNSTNLAVGDQIIFAGNGGNPVGMTNIANNVNYVQAVYWDGTYNWLQTLNYDGRMFPATTNGGNGDQYIIVKQSTFDVQGTEVDCQAIDAGQNGTDATIPANFYTPTYTPGRSDAGILTGQANPPPEPTNLTGTNTLTVQSVADFAVGYSALVNQGFLTNDAQIAAITVGPPATLTITSTNINPSPIGTMVQLGSDLENAAAAGASALTIHNIQDFRAYAGGSILIDTGLNLEESDGYTTTGAHTINLSTALLYNHLGGGVGTPVVVGSMSTAAVNVGGTSISVNDPADFVQAGAGSTVVVDSGAYAEQLTILSVAGNVVTFTSGFQYAHASNIPVSIGTLVSALSNRSIWLQLAPLPAAQQDGRGGILYSATWTTPTVASDYYIDVVTYDNAQWPIPYNLNTGFENEQSNWRIYDNVWGFTTNTFTGQHGILIVNDYSLPQKFFDGKFGTGGVSNAPGANYYGSESYITDIDDSYLDTNYWNATTAVDSPLTTSPPPASLPDAVEGWGFHNTGGTDWPEMTPIYGDIGDSHGYEPNIYSNYTAWPEYGYGNTLGLNSYSDGQMNGGQTIDNTFEANSQQYDIWRILCRGPIPLSVLDLYAPSVQTQPANPVDGNPARQVAVANGCVIWQSPFTGDEFAANGTLADPNTQANLISFIQQGGRLYVSGKDVGYALTGDTPNGANTFLNNYLNAQFDADEFGYGGGAANKGGTGRISGDAWSNWTHSYYIPTGNNNFGYDSLAAADEEFYLPVFNNGDQFANDATRSDPGDRDAITPGGGAQVELQFTGGGNSDLIDTTIPSTVNTNINAIVVYSSWGGVEAIGQDEHRYTNINQELGRYYDHNVRTKLMHNIICYLRTGAIYGNVYNAGNAGQPIQSAIVIANGAGGEYTGVTDSLGHFQIEGLQPGAYTLTGYKAGFAFQHAGGASVTHGGDFTNQNLLVNEVAPGVVVVTVLDGSVTPNAPLAGVAVTVSDVTGLTGTAIFTGTTNAQGQVTFSQVPAGIYNVTANGTAIGYSTASATVPITVATGATTDVTLILTPATIVVTVTDSTTGLGVPGVSVTGTGPSTLGPAVTNVNGQVTFSHIDLNGTYVITANGLAVGYSTATGSIITTPSATNLTLTFPVAIAVNPLPAIVSGTVKILEPGQPDNGASIGGATIQISQGGAPVASTTSAANGSYTLPSVPAGSYTVAASAPGYVTSSVTVTLTRNESLTQAFKLVPAGNLTVTVVDAATKTVLPGVSVTGAVTITGPFTCSYGPSTTAVNGQVTFANVQEGTYTVTANGKAIGYSTATVTDPTSVGAASTLTVDLTALPATVSGKITILDPGQPDNGAGLGGASVQLSQGARVVEKATTAANGTYTLAPVPAGQYTITVGAGGYASATVALTLTRGQLATENLQISPAGNVTVTVVDSVSKATIPGVTVTGVSVQSPYTFKYGPSVTNKSGQVVFTGIHEGSYTFTANGLAQEYDTVSMTSSVGPVSNVTIDLTGIPATVTGNVTSLDPAQPDNNVGIAGALIQVLKGSSVVSSTTSSSAGTYALPPFPAGTYMINVSATGYVTQSATLTVARGQRVAKVFQLIPAGNVTVSVIDAQTRAPLNGVAVTGVVRSGAYTFKYGPKASAGSGQVVFSNVHEGSFTFTANGQAIEYNTVSVTSSVGPSTSLTIGLTGLPATVSGRVTSLDPGQPDNGSAIAGALVKVMQGSIPFATTTTAANGTYTLPPIQAGAYTVAVSATGYVTATTSMTLARGQVVTQNFQLVPAGNLTVTVIDGQTKGVLAGVAVSAVNGRFKYGPTVSNGKGQVVFANVQEGSFTVTGNGSALQYNTVTVAATVGAATSVTVALAGLPATVSGIVTSVDSGEPDNGAGIEGATVEALTGNTLIAEATTGPKGAYTLPPIEAGSYTILVSATGFITQKMSLTVARNQNLTEDFALVPAGNLTVSVIDSQTRAALSGVAVTATSGAYSYGPMYTASNGSVKFANIREGTFTVTADGQATVYNTVSVSDVVGASSAVTIGLQPLPAEVSGVVTNLNGNPVSGAALQLTLGNTVLANVTSGTDGSYTLPPIAAGTYSLSVTDSGYVSQTAVFTVARGEVISVNFQLAQPGQVSRAPSVTRVVTGRPVK
jgi:hypothetical protein